MALSIADISVINLQTKVLSNAEIDLLIEAVDLLPTKGDAAQVLTSIVGAMLCAGDEAAKKKFDERRQEEIAQAQEARESYKTVSALLKAKLLMMREVD